MKYSNPFHQVCIFLVVSLIISISINFLRSDTIGFRSKKLNKVESLDQLNSNNNEGIKEVSLKIAQNLFEKNILFVDARAEEYYLEGHIPGAICFDNFDSLVLEIDSRIQNNSSLIVYCSDDDCGSSEELSYQLLNEGFTNIYLFKGGWKQWVENKMPVERP